MAQQKRINTSHDYTYTVVFESEPEGGYTVTCPALAGLVTFGETIDEAREMAKEAIEGYLEGLTLAGEDIPPGEEHEQHPLRDEVTVTLKSA